VRSVGTVVLTAIGVMRPSGLGPRVRLCITSLAAASPGRSAALAVSPAEDLLSLRALRSEHADRPGES
jgi:hypothetical protein